MGNLEFVGNVADPVELANKQIMRLTLERAACIVEALQGNPTYSQAWRLAARAIRRAKPD